MSTKNEITLISLRVDDDTGIIDTETEIYWTAYWKLKSQQMNIAR